MRVTFNTNGGRLSITGEGETQKDVFKQLSELQEVFDNTVCGVCNTESVRFVVRNVDDNDYYELQCQNIKCKAKLAFGQHKKGGSLFPKRKNEAGEWLPNGGWVKWVKKDE